MQKIVLFSLFVCLLLGCASSQKMPKQKEVIVVSDEYILNVFNERGTFYDDDGRPFGFKILGISEERLVNLFSLEVKAERVDTTSGIQVRRTAIINDMEITFALGLYNRVLWNLPVDQSTYDRIAAYSEKYKIKRQGENYIYLEIERNIEFGIVFNTDHINMGLIKRN